jgi:hypothetical protein
MPKVPSSIFLKGLLDLVEEALLPATQAKRERLQVLARREVHLVGQIVGVERHVLLERLLGLLEDLVTLVREERLELLEGRLVHSLLHLVKLLVDLVDSVSGAGLRIRKAHPRRGPEGPGGYVKHGGAPSGGGAAGSSMTLHKRDAIRASASTRTGSGPARAARRHGGRGGNVGPGPRAGGVEAARARCGSGSATRRSSWPTGDNALGEAWARAIASRMGRTRSSAPDPLVRVLSLDSAEAAPGALPRGARRAVLERGRTRNSRADRSSWLRWSGISRGSRRPA